MKYMGRGWVHPCPKYQLVVVTEDQTCYKKIKILYMYIQRSTALYNCLTLLKNKLNSWNILKLPVVFTYQNLQTVSFIELQCVLF